MKIFGFNRLSRKIIKNIPKLIIDEQFDNILLGKLNLCAIVYHIGDSPTVGHYVACVKKDNIWYMCNDTVCTVGVKLTCDPFDQDMMVPYLLIYEKDSEFELPASTNITDHNCSALNNDKVSNDCPNERNRMNLLKELDIQKNRIAKADQIAKERNLLLSEISSARKLVLESKKEKRKLQSCLQEMSSRDANEPKVQKVAEELNVCDEGIDDAKKVIECKISSLNGLISGTSDISTMKTPIKRKKKYSSSISTKRVQALRSKLDDETLANIQEKNTEEHRTRRSKLDNETKAKIQEKNTEEHKKQRRNLRIRKEIAFNAVQGMSMVDPSILNTEAYGILRDEVFCAFKQGPEYECTICFKLEFKRTVIRLDPSRYDNKVFEKCYQDKTEFVCKSCDNYMKKGKIPPQSQVNNMYLCPKIEELECLGYLECMLISQIIPFMSIIAKQKSSQNGLKGQCVLVPADLKKIQKVLPRSCNEQNIVSIALKRRLSDTGAYHQQNINATNVNRALEKLIEINPFYQNVRIDSTWETISKENDPDTWNLLTNPDAEALSDETDSDEEIAHNSRENGKHSTTNVFPTALHNKDGPDQT